MIIHTAALTGTRQWEDNKEIAYQTNVVGTQMLVDSCLRHCPECYFVYICTACVFRGDRGNYSERDIPYLKNFYSLTKLLGEWVVTRSNLKNWLVVRTNFAARERWPFEKAFADRYGTYLFADDLARALCREVEERHQGILHVCGDRKLSMFEFARLTRPDVQPMTLAQY